MSESMGPGPSGEAMPTGPEAVFTSEPTGLAGMQGGGELMAEAAFAPAPAEAAITVEAPAVPMEGPQATGVEPLSGPTSEGHAETAPSGEPGPSDGLVVHEAEAPVLAEAPPQTEVAEPVHQEAVSEQGETPVPSEAQEAPDKSALEATAPEPPADPGAEATLKPEAGPDGQVEVPLSEVRETIRDFWATNGRYNLAPHEDQPSPRPVLETGEKTQSHHPQSQKFLTENVANYSAEKHPTILLPTPVHTDVNTPQKAEMRTMDRDQYVQELGTSRGMERANKLLTDAGVPENKAGEAIMREDGYLKGTTPLSKVGETIRDYWASKGMTPP